MYYQQGDYYKGDYYRGDPGIFSKIGHVIKGAAVGFVTGGPIGLVRGVARGVGQSITEETLAAGDTGSAYTPAMRARHAAIVARGGSGLITRGGLANQGGGPGMAMVPTGVMPHLRRMHANRATYVTRGGGTSRWPVGIQVHPKGTELVPSRRMNVANPRALRRAIHRVTGFGRIVRRMKRAIARASSAVGNIHRAQRRLPGVRRR